jgi:hypothetical protein
VQQLADLLTDPVQVCDTQVIEDLSGYSGALNSWGAHAVLADKAKQDVLGSDVAMTELKRLTLGKLKHPLGAGGERDVPGRRLLTLADNLLDLLADRL